MPRPGGCAAPRLRSRWESRRDAAGVCIHKEVRAIAEKPAQGAETNALAPRATRPQADDSAEVEAGGWVLDCLWRTCLGLPASSHRSQVPTPRSCLLSRARSVRLLAYTNSWTTQPAGSLVRIRFGGNLPLRLARGGAVATKESSELSGVPAPDGEAGKTGQVQFSHSMAQPIRLASAFHADGPGALGKTRHPALHLCYIPSRSTPDPPFA